MGLFGIFIFYFYRSNGVTVSFPHSQDIFNGTNVTTTVSPVSSACQLVDYSRGIAKLNLDGYEDVDVPVTVTVIENSSQDQFTQTIAVVSTTSPELAIKYAFPLNPEIIQRDSKDHFAKYLSIDLK